MPDGPRYDDDYYAWTQYQAEVLRTMHRTDNRLDRELVAEAEALPRLKSLISREAGGRGRVTVVLDLPSREVELTLPGGFQVNPGIRAAVKSLPGILDVHDI